MKSGAVRAVLTNRSVFAALVGFGTFTLVLHGVWLALVVYALENGGTAEVGIVTFGILVPAALASPLVAVLFDRFSARVALAGNDGLHAHCLSRNVFLDAIARAPNSRLRSEREVRRRLGED